MSKLNRRLLKPVTLFLRTFLMLICLGLLALIAVIYYPPEFLVNWAVLKLEAQIAKATGMELLIGHVDLFHLRPSRQEITLKRVRLYGYQNAPEPAVVIPELQIKANLLNYLLGNTQVAQIIASHALIRIVRDPSGQLNIRPKTGEKKEKDPNAQNPDLPRIAMVLDDAILIYRDENRDLSIDEVVAFNKFYADLDDTDWLFTAIRARHTLAKVDFHSQSEIFEGEGQAQVHLNSYRLSHSNKIAEKFEPMKDLEIYDGDILGEVHAEWDSYDKLAQAKYIGSLFVDGLDAKVPFYRDRVLMSGRVAVLPDQMTFTGMDVQTGTSHIEMTGKLSNYLKEPLADLHVKVQNLAIDPTIAALDHPAVEPLKELRLAGNVNGQAHLLGPVKNPLVKGTLNIPRFNMPDIQVRNASTNFEYQDMNARGTLVAGLGQWKDVDARNVYSLYAYTPESLTLNQLRANAFQGAVSGNLQLGLQAKTIQGQVRAAGASVGEIRRELGLAVPAAYRPNGRASAQATLSGAWSNPRVQGRVYSPALYFPQSDKLSRILDLSTQFDYSKAYTRANLTANSADAGLVRGNLSMRNMDQFSATLDVAQLPLRSANNWSPRAYIQDGTARLDAEIQGSLNRMKRDWMAFTGSANFYANDVELLIPYKDKTVPQQLDDATLVADWNDGRIDIAKVTLSEQDSALSGQGEINLRELLQQKDPEEAFDGKLQGDVQLAHFPILQEFNVQKGRVNLELEADSSPQGLLMAKVKSQGENLFVRGVNIDKVELASSFDGRTLDIQTARLVQDKERLEVTGQVELNEGDPKMNLEAHADDFGLQTLVGLVPPEFKSRFEVQDKDPQLPEPDQLDDRYELPNIDERNQEALQQSSEGQRLNWKVLSDHVDRWRLPPSNRDKQVGPPKQNLIDSLKGKLSLNAKIQGTTQNPDVQVKSVLSNSEVLQARLSEAYLNAHLKGKQLELSRLSLVEPEGGRLNVSGEVDLNADMNLDIEGRGVRLKIAEPFLQGRQMRLNGGLNFDAKAQGPLKDPQVEAQVQVNELLLNKLYFDEIDLETLYAQGYLNNTDVKVYYGDQRVSANGKVPVPDLSKPMDVQLKLSDDSFGLMNLFTQAVDWRAGKGEVLVRVLGSPKKPQLEGQFALQDAEIYLPALKEAVTGLQAKGELKRLRDERGIIQQNVELESVDANFGGGKIQAKGSMDLLDLLPSYFNLETDIQDVTLNYLYPGLFDTQTTVKDGKIYIRGLINQPIISGNLELGKNGKTTFPFIRGSSDLPVSNEISDEEVEQKPRFLFGGLKVNMPADYKLSSPIFDIPISTDPKGIRLRHRGGRLNLEGVVIADEGVIYLLNNVLEVENLSVVFERPRNARERAIDPQFALEAQWNLDEVNEPVRLSVTGSLSKISSKEIEITFSNTQGLSRSELLAKFFGADLVSDLTDVNALAGSLGNQVLRGLFDPLTSQISRLLGLEELSLGIAGQSIKGPTFKYTIRSKPFFLFEDEIEEQLPQLSFVNDIGLWGTGLLADESSYELGANYRFNSFWSLDYRFEQIGSIHNATINGNYPLDFVLKWADYVRTTWFGWEPPKQTQKGLSQDGVFIPDTPYVQPGEEQPLSKETPPVSNGQRQEQSAADSESEEVQNEGNTLGPGLW